MGPGAFKESRCFLSESSELITLRDEIPVVDLKAVDGLILRFVNGRSKRRKVIELFSNLCNLLLCWLAHGVLGNAFEPLDVFVDSFCDRSLRGVAEE